MADSNKQGVQMGHFRGTEKLFELIKGIHALYVEKGFDIPDVEVSFDAAHVGGNDFREMILVPHVKITGKGA